MMMRVWLVVGVYRLLFLCAVMKIYEWRRHEGEGEVGHGDGMAVLVCPRPC